ncbi:MAG: YjgN family protein [Gammaproteobacteria bacterium]|nr:YjgN family protein [Gammaproteobacteria bacterium]
MEEENSDTRELSIEFTGSGSEYFGIWIVNILLTILTLGIYTAWAKVRTRKYFYNNTRMDGAIFDYHASPIAILKGWAIVVGVLIVQQVLSSINILYGLGLLLAIMAFIPWAMVRSRVFNLLNTSYRNVRFYFEREYKELYTIFLIAPLPIIVGYGLFFYVAISAESAEVTPDTGIMALAGVFILAGFVLLPYYLHRFYSFIITRSSFGRTPFENCSSAGAFYSIYLKAFGLGLLVGVAMMVVMGVSAGLADVADGVISVIMGVLAFVIYLIGIYYVIYFIEATKLNEIWGKTSIDGNRFISKLEPWGLMWVMLSNTVLIVITLGIYIPWAHVRMTRYRLNHLLIEVTGDMDNYIAKGHKEMGALGAELGDAMDFEISL